MHFFNLYSLIFLFKTQCVVSFRLGSYALFDMDGNQVPQELVREVGVTFKQILEEVCGLSSHIF